MSYIFISYSDQEFDYAQEIVDALVVDHLEAWANWKNHTRGEDWSRETYRGIEGADTFLFLLSPNSVVCERGNIEIAYAITTGKRILPIVIQDADLDDFLDVNVKKEISKRNWIFCRRGQDDFNQAIQEITKTINTDYDWLKYHTRLQVDAAEWKRHDYEKSRLLRGKELQSAEYELALNAAKEPYPTDLQKEYVRKSRQTYDRQRKITALLVFMGIFSIVIAAVAGIRQRDLALEHGLSTQAGRLAAQSEALRDSNFPVALLLGVEAHSMHEDNQTLSVLRDNTQSNPQLRTYWYGTPPGGSEKFYSLSLSPDGNTIAIGIKFKILLRDVESGKPIGQPLGKRFNLHKIAFSPDGKKIAFGDLDHNIVLWDIELEEPVDQPLQGHNNSVTNLAFSPDGKILASAGLDNTIILWDVETGKPIAELSSNLTSASQLVFRPDGKILLFNGIANKTILWDSETGQTISLSFEEQAPERGLVISPDGNTLVSYTWWDMTFHFWDVNTGQPTGQPLIASTDQGSSIAFSPDGKMLASPGLDNSIYLWDVESGQQLGQPLRGHINDHIELVFSPDGSKLAGGDDSMIVFWDLDSDTQPIEELKPQALIQLTCERVGRNFTQAEWTQYFPSEDYRITCPQWPAG